MNEWKKQRKKEKKNDESSISKSWVESPIDKDMYVWKKRRKKERKK